MSIKLILLDIDGTLTNSRKVITPATRNALLKAQENGVTLALCSGRPDIGLYQYADVLDMTSHNGIFVSFNGSRVINCQTKEVLFNQPMTVAEVKAVLKHLKSFDVVPVIQQDYDMYVTDVFNHDIHMNDPQYPAIFNVLKYESRNNGYLLSEKRDLLEFTDFEQNKLMTYGEPEYLKAHWQEMAEPFKDSLNSMFTAPFYYEYTAKGIDKAKAIETALTPLGFRREEMIAFGDAQNDISMIQYAGIGVAMGNATDEVKQIADEVTATNDEDGIALSLYRHIPEIF